MFYYVIANNDIQKITTDAVEYNDLISKKTCHKKCLSRAYANFFLKSFNKFSKKEYNAFADFEFTCTDKIKYFQNKAVRVELLSVGICITDNQGNIVDKFYETVKPKFNYVLTDFCKNLTHLSQKTIDRSDTFLNVLSRADEFIKLYHIKEINVFGPADAFSLKYNFKFFKNNKKSEQVIKFINKIKNIQTDISKWIIDERRTISLQDAKLLCGIKGDVSHNALSDAIDLSKVTFAAFYNPPSFQKSKKYKVSLKRFKFNKKKKPANKKTK